MAKHPHTEREAAILDRGLTGVPGEENLDLDVVPTGEPPIKRHQILNRM